MSKVLNVLKNKWFILGVSLLNVLYPICLCYFAYAVFFYDIEYVNKTKFAILYSIFSLVIGLLMFYTRKSPLTSIFAMINLVIFFPTMLLDWGNWPLLIPAALVILFGFFSCKMNDTFKTVLGTIFLLVYIVGSVAFFLVMNVFRIQTTDTLVDYGVSPSGDFRYYVMDVQNNASGKTAVYVQPNTLDLENSFIKLDCTIKRLVKQAMQPTVAECKWDGTSLMINGEEYFNENEFVTDEDGVRLYDFSNGNWTYTYFSINYPLLDIINSMTEIITDKIGGDDKDETAVTDTTDVTTGLVETAS